MESNVTKVLARQKFMFSKLHILCILKIYMYLHIDMYAKVCLLCLEKAWNRTSKKLRDGEIGKHKLNEMGALNMKNKKWNKQDKIEI